MNIRESVVPFDIDIFITNMVHAAEADDSKFGGIAAITNGVHVRKEDDMFQNLGNYTKNSDYKSLRDFYGVVVRVRPDKQEIIKVIIRDDLSSLTSIRVSALGQFTQGEL